MFVAVFIAKSQAMIGDSAAMVIDSLTYLFNSYAERIKNKSMEEADDETLSESDKNQRRLGRTRQRLWLEILPPMCSVMTLIILTMYIIMDAFATLAETATLGEGGVAEDDKPNIGVMFFFSALNLALDILNVTCFARAKHAFGFAVIDEDRHRYMLEYDGSLHNTYADSMRVRSEVDLSGMCDDDDNEEVGSRGNYNSLPESQRSPLQISKTEEKKHDAVNLK